MRRRSCEAGYLLVDVIMGLVLFSFVLLSIYQVYGPTFSLYQGINSRLSAQQDVRLALDRVARALHETSSAYGRFRIYSPETGCDGMYDGCLGFVTARDAKNCTGAFQLVDGAPNWQATLYLWRDVASKELRLRCDPSTTFPVAAWPPPVESYTVVGRHIVSISVTPEPAGGRRSSAIAIALQEQSETSMRRSPAMFFNETIFLPQNR